MSRVEDVDERDIRLNSEGLQAAGPGRDGPNWPRLPMTMRESVISHQPLSCLSQAPTYLLLNLYTETQS